MAIRQFYRLTAAVIMGVITCLWLSMPASASEILRLNLDSADALGTLIAADQKVKFEGKGSIRVSTKWPIIRFLWPPFTCPS